MNQTRLDTVCLTFDFDALSVWLGGYSRVTPAMLSRGEFGARVGVPRVLELLARYEVGATFFTPGHTAESFPDAVAAVLEAGHEVGHHGYGHEDPSTQTPAEERASLERGLAALEKAAGQRPWGYRSPSWDYSDVTLSLLVEYGFVYDSSLFADDFYPYRPRLGDIVSKDRPLQRGEPAPIWEFPVHFSLDDWPHFTSNFDPYRVGLSAPSKVLEIWAAEFDYMRAHAPGGVLTLTMHPQVIGRGHRMAMLERLIEHILAGGNVRFARLIDVAREMEEAGGR
jgi:peptidoglycan/xylan/chitin deacetylase (PgdA/CDA1 family)